MNGAIDGEIGERADFVLEFEADGGGRHAGEGAVHGLLGLGGEAGAEGVDVSIFHGPDERFKGVFGGVVTGELPGGLGKAREDGGLVVGGGSGLGVSLGGVGGIEDKIGDDRSGGFNLTAEGGDFGFEAVDFEGIGVGRHGEVGEGGEDEAEADVFLF